MLVWLIAAATIAAILIRPRNLPEAIWACCGAVLLVICRALPVTQAVSAMGKGTDVYLFLTGMMLLSELARGKGVFDWLASLAVRASKGSHARLFTLIYMVGIVVTVFLSNDATAVVLTPAVYAAVRKARAKPMPYLLICAFIANAASFVLPISNPANLVLYGKQLPPLLPWLQSFLMPSCLAIGATYIALRWLSRKDLTRRSESTEEKPTLSKDGRRAGWGILGTAGVLLAASASGVDLGLPTLLAALLATAIATHARWREMRDTATSVSWSVLPLVAGLFVIVEALNNAGAARDIATLLQRLSSMPKATGAFSAAFGIAALSNVMNNLPSGLLAGTALQIAHVPAHIRDAVLIGVDLGPNLSVTGSLATVLWLMALRREGENISAWQFLRAGLIVMPPALLLATLGLVRKL